MRPFRFVGHFTYGVLAIVTLAMCLEVCVGVARSVGEPFMGYCITDEGFVNSVALDVWDADRAGFNAWDRVVAVDGQLTFSGAQVRAEALTPPIGRAPVYELETVDGRRHFATIPSRIFSASDVLRSQASLAFLGLACVVIAVLLYFVRPGTLEAWAFFLFFASIGLSMVSVVDMTMLWRLPPLFPYVMPFIPVFGFLLVGAITKAFSTAATQDREGKMLRRIMVVLMVVSTVISSVIAFQLRSAMGNMPRYREADILLYTYLTVATGAGVSALLIAYRRGRAPRRRARIRQILWAWPVAAGIPTLNLFIGHVLGLSTMSFLWNGFVILMPLSTADAIVRHDLLHLNTTARRLVGGMTIAAAMGTILGLALWAASRFFKVSDAAGMVALAALLFAVASPLTHRVQRYVEDLLRSFRYDSGSLLAHFTARASTATYLSDVTSRLEETLESSVKPRSFELYRLAPDTPRLYPEVDRFAAPIEVTPEMRAFLARTEAAVFDDEVIAPVGLEGAALALPLTVANEPVGLLVVGQHRDGLPYEGGDVAFVTSLAGPLAAALVNTRAYEEVETLNRDLEGRVIERTAALQDINEELARLNQRKDELVATISHDFRSPLAIIRQNVQTILRDMGQMDEDDLRHFLEGVARQETRLTSMCTNLLDLARLKNRRLPADKVDVGALAAQIVADYEMKAEAAGVDLILERDENEPVRIQGDAARMEQVLQNLVDNAIKFTPRAGEVRVTVENTGDQAVLTVADTGCGVPQDALPRLFEPFYQVPRQSHVGQGSGLGLAIVNAIIEAHRGEVSVQSAENEGTTFVLSFPLAGTWVEESRKERPAQHDSGDNGGPSAQQPKKTAPSKIAGAFGRREAMELAEEAGAVTSESDDEKDGIERGVA